MTALATMKKWSLTLGPPAGANALVPVANPNNTPPGIKQELDQAIAISDLVRTHHAAMTCGLRNFGQSRAQKVAHSLPPNALVGWGIAATCFGFFTGVLGAQAACDYKSIGMSPGTVFTGAMAAFVFLEAALVAVGVTAHKVGEAQARRCVTKQDLAPVIHAFDESVGSNKALAGAFLAEWRATLHAGKALSPEAREQLEEIQKSSDCLAQDVRERATLWRNLVDQIQKNSGITDHTVDCMHKVIERFPLEQRHELAVAVRDALRASGRKITYEGDHAIHDLPKRYPVSPN